MVKRVSEEWGSLDILVNNAGIPVVTGPDDDTAAGGIGHGHLGMAADQYADEAAFLAALDDRLVALEGAQLGQRRDIRHSRGVEAVEQGHLMAEEVVQFFPGLRFDHRVRLTRSWMCRDDVGAWRTGGWGTAGALPPLRNADIGRPQHPTRPPWTWAYLQTVNNRCRPPPIVIPAQAGIQSIHRHAEQAR